MSSSQKSRKYSNPELREMIQQLVIAGHIDFDTRQRFMEALLHRYHVHHWSAEEARQAVKESNHRKYLRKQLIALYQKHFP